VDEVFQQTYIRKSTGQFVDDRSKRMHVSYFYYITVRFITIYNKKMFSLLHESKFVRRYSQEMSKSASTGSA